MSVLIKGMEMPKNGRVTIELASEETGTNILARITDDKTGKLIEHKGVVEIPTPHGRLIDADRLYEIIEQMEGFGTIDNENDVVLSAVEVLTAIDEAPTIIEAEE